MVGIILASHGKFSEGIKESGQMIFGPQEDVAAIVLTPEMGPDDFYAKVKAAIDTFSQKEEILFLVDLWGGTPFNQCSRLIEENGTVIAKASKAAPKAAKVAAKSAEFKDSRDKQKYRLVKIADREWFGDNLNFKSEGSYCLDDDENNCMAYGRLYTWDAAQKACPAGFRLPAQADFESLWTAAGADFNAGYLIKTDYGWKGETNGNDTLKFSAMPAGNRFDDGTYGNLAKFAFFWSADDTLEGIGQGDARVWYLTNKSMAFGFTSRAKIFAFSVRCVRNAK